MDGDRVKIVYHKEGTSTHTHRWANPADDGIENDTGEWFRAPLVGWHGFPTVEMRTKLVFFHDGAKPKLADEVFAADLETAADGKVPGFDPKFDGDWPAAPAKQ
jgi:hypothetical protein